MRNTYKHIEDLHVQMAANDRLRKKTTLLLWEGDCDLDCLPKQSHWFCLVFKGHGVLSRDFTIIFVVFFFLIIVVNNFGH